MTAIIDHRADVGRMIADNYGTCKKKTCDCLRSGYWLGVICPNWQPVKARTWDELKEEMKGEL